MGNPETTCCQMQYRQLDSELLVCFTFVGDDGSEHDAMTVWVDDWDVGAPWLPWASYSDPIGARQYGRTLILD